MRNDIDSGGAQEGRGDGALASSIFPCSCDDNEGSDGAEEGTSVSFIVHCLCDNDSGISVDNGAFSLSVAPCLCKQEGRMIRGDATAGWRVARGGGMRRADARRRRRNEM